MRRMAVHLLFQWDVLGGRGIRLTGIVGVCSDVAYRPFIIGQLLKHRQINQTVNVEILGSCQHSTRVASGDHTVGKRGANVVGVIASRSPGWASGTAIDPIVRYWLWTGCNSFVPICRCRFAISGLSVS